MSTCRICDTSTVTVLDLGDMAYTGVFPRPHESVESGPLRLAVCPSCGLVQLAESFDPAIMYGDNYGYRSGLNDSMVKHLHRTADRLSRMTDLYGADVLDIGSNDGTLLNYLAGHYRAKAVGIDPTAGTFADYYQADVLSVARFFDADTYRAVSSRSPKLVTSIAMFYDLEDPVGFARDVRAIIADDGLWHIEVAYAPWMLRSGAYDGICHEHVNYYSLTTLDDILRAADFDIVAVATNDTNGGSLAVTAAPHGSRKPEATWLPWMLARERAARIGDPLLWSQFGERVKQHAHDLQGILAAMWAHGLTVDALGASTKGNVLLQYAGISSQLVRRIGDVNPYKYGRVTPGTSIPIVPEREVVDDPPDVLLVLPWHFRTGMLGRLHNFVADGGRVMFPLPDIEVVAG